MRTNFSFLSKLRLRIKYKYNRRLFDFILSKVFSSQKELPDDAFIVIYFDPKAYFYLSYSENILFLSVGMILSLLKHKKPRETGAFHV